MVARAGSAALLLMDFQVAICGAGGRLGASSGLSEQVREREVLPRLAECLVAARSAGVPVLHARVTFDDAYTRRSNRSARFSGMERARLLLEGSDDVAFVPEAAPLPDEAVVSKGCVDPFVGTGLRERLAVVGAAHLYLAGVATNFVVESAARHAGDSGYQVTVLEDLCASYTMDMHEFAVQRTLPMFAEISTSAAFADGVGRGEIVGAPGGWTTTTEGQ